METHQRAVYALAYDLTRRHHDAEDLAQEVFLKAYRSLDQFRGEESQRRAWLYRITTTTYLNAQRKKALRFMQLRDDFGNGTFRQATAPAADQRAEADAMRRHIEQALDGLTARERSAFVLRHHHELPVREVAAAMRVAEGTVKSLLFRSTRKMRDALAFYREEVRG